MDYGAVSFVISQKRDRRLVILQWVLSCRAFQKGVEYAILDRIVDDCRAKGLDQLMVCYEAMEKNGMVQEVIETCGFSPSGNESKGWVVHISDYKPHTYYIEIKELG